MKHIFNLLCCLVRYKEIQDTPSVLYFQYLYLANLIFSFEKEVIKIFRSNLISF